MEPTTIEPAVQTTNQVFEWLDVVGAERILAGLSLIWIGFISILVMRIIWIWTNKFMKKLESNGNG